MSTIRRGRCACGGEIVARDGAEQPAVYAHNETAQHRAWRDAGGIWGLVDPTAGDRLAIAWAVQREQFRMVA